jgi:hypothetical protein
VVDHVHEIHAALAGDTWPDHAWREAVSCRSCGLRTLVLLLKSREWVVRRVERVSFHDDRTIRRQVSMDFVIPPLAPKYQVSGTETVRLVPLTVMRKKTLVNFGIRDSRGEPLSLLSMRHNQALTEQMVLALADVTKGVDSSSPALAEFARIVAAGTQDELITLFDKIHAGEVGDDVRGLLADPAAARLARRLVNNFLLLPPIADDGPSQRVMSFWYDEPLTLTYKTSGYNPAEKMYEHGQRPLPLWAPKRLAAVIGWSPTVVRFPTPAAENTQSYHFEVEAPSGVMIASASMVAGRPNEPVAPSWDHVEGGFPVVNLHVVDVPNGSMSRTQVSLRLSRRGWLTASALASAFSSVLLWAAGLLHVRGEQGQTVATALLAVTAAVIVFIVRPDEHQMASRLVTTVRAAATVSVFLLVAVGVLITFRDQPPQATLRAAAVVGTICTLLVLVGWARARPSRSRISPWEQGLLLLDDRSDRTTVAFDNLEDARRRFGFDQPSIKVDSSEGDHGETFNWTDATEGELEGRLLRLLAALGSGPAGLPAPRPGASPTDRSSAADHSR